MREFAPKVKETTFRGSTAFEVDCRPWRREVARLGHPTRRRFDTKKEAERWCRQLVVDHEVGRPLDPGPVAVRSLCDLYLTSVKNSDSADTTHDTYRSRLHRFIGFLETLQIKDIRDVSVAVMDAYRIDCATHLARSTQVPAMGAVQGMFRWATRLGYASFNPVDGLIPARPKAERRGLSEEERKALLEDGDPELLLIWRLLLLTGLRRREIVEQSLADTVLDSPAPFLRVKGKGSKVRIVPLTETAQAIVAQMIRKARAAGRERLLGHGYREIYVAWIKERDRLKLPKDLTLHSFRHTFATFLVNQTNTPLTEAARVMGHSSTRITEDYVDEDQAVLRRGMQRLDAEMVSTRYQATAPEAVDPRTARVSGD